MNAPRKSKDNGPAEGAVLLVNAQDNEDARWDMETFARAWHWIEAPSGWEPGQSLEEPPEDLDAIIVFTTRYEERACRTLCEAIRRHTSLRDVPLLAAVNQYQMPLANRVKELPKADFIFTPIREEDLRERVQRLAPGSG